MNTVRSHNDASVAALRLQRRYEILSLTRRAHYTITEVVDSGKQPLYRTRQWKRETKETQICKKKTNWYKKGGGELI